MGPNSETQVKLTEAQWVCIDLIAEEFEQALQAGCQLDMDQYLAQVNPTLRERLREELIGVEFAHQFGDVVKESKLRYWPVRKLGQGAFGVVYKAWDKVLARPVALKVLLKTDGGAKRNFLNEVRRQANFKHHLNLVMLHDSGTLPKGQPFAVMEYVSGGNLRQKLNAEHWLAPEVAAHIAAQVAEAVAAVQEGMAETTQRPPGAIVHQDLKPENILIDANGGAHVADFGLAATVADLHDGAAPIGGTPAYLSPEQATAFRPGTPRAPIDARSDIWALGVILYEMLCGKQPFRSESTDPHVEREDIIESILMYRHPQLHDLNPDVLLLPEMERLVDKCLEKDPAKRVQSAADLAKLLRSWLDSIEAIPRPIDFSLRLDVAREGFVGRRWLFEKIDAWPEHRDQRVLLLVGEAGCGKSAFLAELIHQNPQGRIVAWHVCCDKWPETRTPGDFVRSLAGMLAANIESYRQAFGSDALRETLRPEKCQADPASAFETAIATPIANATPPGDGVFFIIIDALDEADLSSTVSIPELLSIWERYLPDWLRIIASTRRGGINADKLSGVRSLNIDRDNTDDAANLREDILLYLRGRLKEPDFEERLVQEQVLAEDAAQELLEKSEGNFLYLVEALTAVLRDLYTFRQLDELPPGLPCLYCSFFERQWPNRRSFAVVRPILEVLVSAHEPVPEGLLEAAVELSPYQVAGGLDQLAEYLDQKQDGISLRHQAMAEWLTTTHGMYRVVTNQAQDRLINACWLECKRKAPPSKYSLRYLAAHFIETEDWARLEQLLTDLFFLEAKVEAGMVFDLVREYALAAEKMPANRPRWRILQALGKALRKDANFIFRHPTTFFQCMWNTCWWHDCAEADRHYEAAQPVTASQVPSGSALRPRRLLAHLWLRLKSLLRPDPARDQPDGSLQLLHQTAEPILPPAGRDERCEPPERPLSELMESWRRLKTEVSPGFLWLRSLRPPPLELRSGKTAILGQLDGPIVSLVFSSDGQRLAAGSFWGSVALWNVHTGQLVGGPQKVCDQVYGLTWQESGLRFGGAFYSQSSGSVTVVSEDDDPQFLTLVNDRIDDPVLSLDGTLLFGKLPDGTIRIWDTVAGKELDRLESPPNMSCAAISPNGKLVVVCSFSAQLAMWIKHRDRWLLDWRSSRLYEHPGCALCVAFSPDSGSVAIGFEHGVRLFDAGTGDEIRPIGRSDQGARYLAFSPDGRLLVSGMRRTLRVHDVKTGKEIAMLHVPEDNLRCVAFSPDGRCVAGGHSFGKVRIWKWNAPNIADTRRLSGHEDDITSIAVSPNGRLIASVSDRKVLLWDVRSGTMVAHSANEFRRKSGQTCFSPNGQLVAAGRGRALQIWDTSTGKELKSFCAEDDIGCVAFSPDGLLVAAGCGRWPRWVHRPDCRVWVWKLDVVVVDDGALKCHLYPPGHEIDVLCVAFSRPDGRRLATGAADGSITIWDIDTGNEIRQITGHKDSGYMIVYTSNGEPRIIQMQDDVKRGVRALAYTSNGQQLVSRSMDGTLRIWDAKSGDCCKVIIGTDDVTAVADSLSFQGNRNHSELETEIVRSTTGESIAWWPGDLRDFDRDPSGRIWAGRIDNYLCLFSLEGDV